MKYKIKDGPLDGRVKEKETDYPKLLFGIRENGSSNCHIYRLIDEVWIYTGLISVQ